MERGCGVGCFESGGDGAGIHYVGWRGGGGGGWEADCGACVGGGV